MAIRRLRALDEMAVFPLEEPDATADRRFEQDAFRLPHRGDQAFGHAQAADAPALGLDVHRPLRARAASTRSTAGSRRASAAAAARRAGRRAASRGGRRAPRDPGPGRPPRATRCRSRLLPVPVKPHTTRQRKRSRQRLQVGEHRAAVGAVAAFQTARLPADLGEHVRERGAALPAAPAIDERTPGARAVEEALAQMPRDIAAHERRAELARLERRALLVDRPDARALLVVQHRAVDGAAHVIRGELALRARVDDLVKAGRVVLRLPAPLRARVESPVCGTVSPCEKAASEYMLRRP